MVFGVVFKLVLVAFRLESFVWFLYNSVIQSREEISMVYQEFKTLLDKLWQLHNAISKDSDGTLISNWNSSHIADHTIDFLTSQHPKMAKKYYSHEAWVQAMVERTCTDCE